MLRRRPYKNCFFSPVEYSLRSSIRKYSTTAYHPQSNGALERSHQGLVDYIKHYTEQYKTTWDKWIDFAIFSYNTTPHTVTKFTPYELVFGRKSNLPSLLTNCNDPIYTFEDYLTELKTKLQHSFNIARDRILDYKERNKTYYDKKVSHNGTRSEIRLCYKKRLLPWINLKNYNQGMKVHTRS